MKTLTGARVLDEYCSRSGSPMFRSEHFYSESPVDGVGDGKIGRAEMVTKLSPEGLGTRKVRTR